MNQLVEISRRSLLALQAAMNVVGQNVANAESEGYTRRRVTFQADSTVSHGIIMRNRIGSATGAGVSIASYERIRDTLLQDATWEARSALGAAEEDQRLLAALEAVFPSGASALSNQLNAFWNAWSDLADHPTDNGVRLALRDRALALTTSLNGISQSLSTLGDETLQSLSSGVDEVNGILREIAELNAGVEASRMKGSPDFVGEDRRDELIGQLAEYGPVRVVRDGARGYTVTLNGMTVVQGDHVVELQLDTSGATPQVLFGNTGVAYRAPEGEDGKLGAWLRMLNATLPDTRAALDDLANALVTEVNARHNPGYGLDGGTGRDFFDPAFTTAGSIRLSADVLADTKAIAASGDATALGDSSVALDIASLSTLPVLGGGTESMEDYAINLVAGIGAKLERASTKASGQAAVVDHLQALERGVSGVSLDEELTNLIKYQQAFAASARVLNTAEEMMDTLLSM